MTAIVTLASPSCLVDTGRNPPGRPRPAGGTTFVLVMIAKKLKP
jgi:hypothetical protein